MNNKEDDLKTKSILARAVADGDAEKLRKILREKPERVNTVLTQLHAKDIAKPVTLLHYAISRTTIPDRTGGIKQKALASMQVLLEEGADPNPMQYLSPLLMDPPVPALHYALQKGAAEAAMVLLQHPEFNTQVLHEGDNAVHTALRYLEKMCEPMDSALSIEQQVRLNAMIGFISALEGRVDMNAYNKENRSAVSMVRALPKAFKTGPIAELPYARIVEALANAGADLDRPYKPGGTSLVEESLHLSNGRSLLQVLLWAGADGWNVLKKDDRHEAMITSTYNYIASAARKDAQALKGKDPSSILFHPRHEKLSARGMAYCRAKGLNAFFAPEVMEQQEPAAYEAFLRRLLKAIPQESTDTLGIENVLREMPVAQPTNTALVNYALGAQNDRTP